DPRRPSGTVTLRVAVASFVLLGAVSGAAQAQYLTDAGSPLGAGAGQTGSVAPYVSPARPGAIARSVLRASSSPNAAGARANLIAALGGNAGPLGAAMGGSAQATALAQAIAALGPNPGASSVINAIQAYNAYLDAIAGTS